MGGFGAGCQLMPTWRDVVLNRSPVNLFDYRTANGDRSQIQNSRSSLLRGGCEDPENYFLLDESERRCMAKEGLLARERISSGNDAAQTDLSRSFKSWGDETQQSATTVGTAQREAQQSYTSGRESAYDPLRERK